MDNDTDVISYSNKEKTANNNLLLEISFKLIIRSRNYFLCVVKSKTDYIELISLVLQRVRTNFHT